MYENIIPLTMNSFYTYLMIVVPENFFHRAKYNELQYHLKLICDLRFFYFKENTPIIFWGY